MESSEGNLFWVVLILVLQTNSHTNTVFLAIAIRRLPWNLNKVEIIFSGFLRAIKAGEHFKKH